MNRVFKKGFIIILFGSLIFANNNRDVSIIGPKTEIIQTEDYSQIYYVDNSIDVSMRSDGSKDKPWGSLEIALSTIKDQADINRVAILVAAGIYDESTIILNAPGKRVS